jgi:hypothetical protein
MPFIAGVGVQVGTSDPVFMSRQPDGGPAPRVPARPGCVPRAPRGGRRARPRGVRARRRVAAGGQLGHVPHLGRPRLLRENWDGPIVLKGVQSVRDAHAAMDARMDGIVVSNHGRSHPGLYVWSADVHRLSFLVLAGGRQVDGAAPRRKASSRSCLTRVSGRDATSSRPSQWALKVFWVSTVGDFSSELSSSENG